MAKDKRWAHILTEGTAGNLDNLAAANFEDLDATAVHTDGTSYFYSYDAAATNAELSPLYIRPDDYGAAGVHVLQSLNCNSLTLQDTTTSTTGVIYKGADRFIHNYHDTTGAGGAVPDGNNLCIGVDAGNFTMGSTASITAQSSHNIFIGYLSGYSNTQGYRNVFVGTGSGYLNTTGYRNTFTGNEAGYSNTTGNRNAFTGTEAGYSNTTGYRNNLIGYQSGYSNDDGYYNNFMGYLSGYSNTTGSRNTFIGTESGYLNDDGIGNNFIGYQSGYSNTTSDYCVLIGDNTKISADGVQRETVLGYNTTGKGTDTVILGAEGANDRVYATGGLTVNGEENDVDTNIAASGITNALFVEGSSGNAGIGTGTPITTLDVNGGFATALVAKTGAYTTTAADHTIICGAGNETFTVTLIAAASVTGQILVIKNIGSGTVTVDGNASETIDGATTQSLSSQYDSIMIQSDGTSWWII